MTIGKRPNELWMFWVQGGAHGVGCWLRTLDDVAGAETYMVAISKADAERVVIDQREKWQVNTAPVQVR